MGKKVLYCSLRQVLRTLQQQCGSKSSGAAQLITGFHHRRALGTATVMWIQNESEHLWVVEQGTLDLNAPFVTDHPCLLQKSQILVKTGRGGLLLCLSAVAQYDKCPGVMWLCCCSIPLCSMLSFPLFCCCFPSILCGHHKSLKIGSCRWNFIPAHVTWVASLRW